MQFITVIDVFRRLGLETDKRKTWAVGAIVARKWLVENGTEPPKMNRRKTAGGGSHCFAVYPESWFETIAELAKQTCAELEAQKPQHDLFG